MRTPGSSRVARTSVDHPLLQQRVDVDVFDRPLERAQVVDPDDGLEPVERVAMSLRLDDLELFVLLRIAERRLEEEAVELGFGEREDALVVERILGREDQERARQRVGFAVDGDLALGHRLEQRALGARHRPVDLVDEQDVREHGPLLELECALALVVHGQPRDVGRLQVGGALDASGGGAVDRARDRPRQHGLGRAGDVVQQDMSIGEERARDELDLLALAEHDALDVVQQRRRNGARAASAANLDRRRAGLELLRLDPLRVGVASHARCLLCSLGETFSTIYVDCPGMGAKCLPAMSVRHPPLVGD